VGSAVVDFKPRIDKNVRVSLQLSATVLNSALDSVRIFKNTGTLLQSRQHAGARALFPSGLGRWAETSPILFNLFPFLFQKNFGNML
jgi:hypothetical protein